MSTPSSPEPVNTALQARQLPRWGGLRVLPQEPSWIGSGAHVTPGTWETGEEGRPRRRRPWEGALGCGLGAPSPPTPLRARRCRRPACEQFCWPCRCPRSRRRRSWLEGTGTGSCRRSGRTAVCMVCLGGHGTDRASPWHSLGWLPSCVPLRGACTVPVGTPAPDSVGSAPVGGPRATQEQGCWGRPGREVGDPQSVHGHQHKGAGAHRGARGELSENREAV